MCIKGNDRDSLQAQLCFLFNWKGAKSRLRGPGHTRAVVVAAIEKYRKRVERAEEGDYVGLKLEGVDKEEVQRGDVLSGERWDLDEAGQW